MSQKSFNQIMARDINGEDVAITTAFSLIQSFEVGQRVRDENGNEYEYCKTKNAEDITLADAVLLLAAGIEQLDTTNAASGTGSGARVGVAMAAAVGVSATAKYGWVGIFTGMAQTFTVNSKASCAKYTGLQATATDGVIDDGALVGDIAGMVLSATLGTGDSQGEAILTYPRILETWA